MRAECYGQSRAPDGRQQTYDDDAFAIGRRPVPWIALCDGAGDGHVVARRALVLLEERMGETSLAQLLREEAWVRLAGALDSELMGGPETTLVAAAVVGDQVIGACAGDSRAYVVPAQGDVRLLTADASNARLGSGAAEPLVFRAGLAVRDVLLLVSAGAWGPLETPGLERTVRSMVGEAFADLPSAILDAASHRGLAGDRTAVALRLLKA